MAIDLQRITDNCTELQSLTIEDTNLTDEVLISWLELVKDAWNDFKFLDFSGTHLSNKGKLVIEFKTYFLAAIALIQRWNHLEELKLTRCLLISIIELQLSADIYNPNVKLIT
jgi:hypothetical protein